MPQRLAGLETRDMFEPKKDFHFCNGLDSKATTILYKAYMTQRDMFAAVDSYSLRSYI